MYYLISDYTRQHTGYSETTTFALIYIFFIFCLTQIQHLQQTDTFSWLQIRRECICGCIFWFFSCLETQRTRLVASDVVNSSPLRKLTALPKSLSWI